MRYIVSRQSLYSANKTAGKFISNWTNTPTWTMPHSDRDKSKNFYKLFLFSSSARMLSLIFFIFISAYAGVDFRYFLGWGCRNSLSPPPPSPPPPPLWALANESYASAGSSCFIGIIFLMFSRLELASSSPTS